MMTDKRATRLNQWQNKPADIEWANREKVRQCMYQRIAEGQALMDIEDTARREWGRR